MMAASMGRFATASRGARGALLIVALLVANLLAGAAHLITVPHRLCQIHGELEHGRDSADSGVRQVHQGVQLSASEGGADHAHAGCPLGLCLRTEASPMCLPAGAALVLQLPRKPLPVPAEPVPDPALFLLAPSRSPPA
jgi:hypothetical protein